MYTIKHAAEVTGLSPTTLRAWERRYGIGTPHRTEAGYRLYDQDAVRALTVMAGLVDQGWSPRQAAEETQRLIGEGAERAEVSARGQKLGALTAQMDPREPAPGGAAAAAATSLPTELVEAAARMDAARLAAALDERFSLSSFESVVDGWLMPNLIALGEAWAEGRVSVAGEHLASNTVMRRLAAAYDASSSETTGGGIVVGLPPGCRHELGVLAFAVAARRAGLRVAYVGADLPTGDWATAVAAHQARAVVLSVLRDEDIAELASVVDGLRIAEPGLLVAVGGAMQDRAPQDCLRLGHEIGAGAVRLAAALGAPATVKER